MPTFIYCEPHPDWKVVDMENKTINKTETEIEEHNNNVMLWGYLTATLGATMAALGTIALIKLLGLPSFY